MRTVCGGAGTPPVSRAWRARRVIPLAGERAARGREAWRPLRILDDAVIVERGGRVERVEYFAAFRPDMGQTVRDLGDVTVIPGVVNAHTHMQLSHMAGKTVRGRGFVPWLRSLIALLPLPLETEAIRRAVESLQAYGVAHIGDFTGLGAALVVQGARHAGLGCTLLCEWFGFGERAFPDAQPWPSRFAPAMAAAATFSEMDRFPAGHALYSTDSDTLRAVRRWCAVRGHPFVMHLAESAEETEMLTGGRGPLADLYAERVLPPEWRAPGMSPVSWAHRLGLLGSGTLAVHCVQCAAEDIRLLAQWGTAVCLCPRSNAYIAVGVPPARELLDAGILLCLGTDGLSSNEDLDVLQEARTLCREYAFPPEAVVRLLTVNGAAALGRGDLGTLEPGKRCTWTLLPADLERALGLV